MSIYICGACNSGRAEIARRIAAEYPPLRLLIDPADSVFVPIFGVGLERILRGRRWEGKPDEMYVGVIDYLALLEHEDVVTNEGPLLLYSHLMFFGVLSVFNDEQRKEILTRCFGLFRKGTHFVIRRWAESGNFCQMSVHLQRDIGVGRKNIYILLPATDYESTIEQGTEFIKSKMEVK